VQPRREAEHSLAPLLAWDDLAITRITNETIYLSGFNAPADDEHFPFTVDLATGRSTDAPC